MKKILFVLRDAVPTRIAVQLIRLLSLRGHEIVVIAEGGAVSICKEAGIPLHVEGNASMSKIMTATILRTINPSLVCISCSSPINWELQFAWVAQKSKPSIPVVAIGDIWGALTRLQNSDGVQFQPDMAMVIDNAEAYKVMRAGLTKNTVVIGDVASLPPPQITPEKRAWLEKTCAGKYSVLIVADHTQNAIEVASIATQAIRWEKDPSKFVVFASFVHPKLRNDPNIRPILVLAEAQLHDLNYVHHEDISTDTLASICDVTVTCASTPGRIALHHRKRFLSVVGEASRKILFKEMGADRFHLERAGVIPGINGESSISNTLSDDTYEHRGQEWVRSTLFRPEIGADAIIALLPQ